MDDADRVLNVRGDLNLDKLLERQFFFCIIFSYLDIMKVSKLIQYCVRSKN